MSVPRTQLDEAFAALRADLVNEDGPRISTMRNYRYAIVPYDPVDEFKLREHVQRTIGELTSGGWVVKSIWPVCIAWITALLSGTTLITTFFQCCCVASQ